MEESRRPQERGLPDALRAAIDNTLSSLGDRGPASAGLQAGAARAGELLDEVARRGHDVGSEILRRGEEARAELARRGEEARAEVTRRGQQAQQASTAITAQVIEAVADTLGRDTKPKVEDE